MDDAQESKRAHKRTNMFVIATASSATFSGSVRVRNMSAQGALIEGGELPQLHERVKLRKGDLSASGNVVWRDGNKAGVAFQRSVNAQDWLPTAGRSQQQVDSSFQNPRSGETEGSQTADRTDLSPSPTSRDELEGIADMLDALADDLSEEPMIVERYLEKLQVLDVAAQKLRALASR